MNASIAAHDHNYVEAARREELNGRPGPALRLLNEAISRNLSDADLWLARGSIYYQWSRFHEAYQAFRTGLERFPENLNLQARFAWSAHSIGNFSEAESWMRRLVDLRPNEADAHYGLGVALRSLKRFEPALEAFRATIERDRSAIHAYVNLGVTLMDLRRFEEAETPLREAITIAPDNPGNWVNLGVNLYRQGHADAEEAYQKAQHLESRTGEYVDAFVSYASFLRNTGRLDEAILQYRKYLPEHPSTAGLTQLGMCLLHKGEFRQGWSLYEFRWLQDPLVSLRANLDTPLWQGQEIDGKTVLVRAEQGVGDVIQFARYLREIKSLGAKVLYQGRDGMEELSLRFEGPDAIVRSGEKLPAFDYYTNLMSLPRFLGGNPKDLPNRSPYVGVDDAEVRKFRDRLDPSTLNIGLVWAGNPTHLQDSLRSIALSKLIPITEIPRVRVISLQKGEATTQLDDLGQPHRIDDWAASLKHFGDTADAIEALDLVISVDTSVAHLAGALGKPVWILLPTPAEWRWMDHRVDSDWYPGARLFRQATMGDWSSVVRDLTTAIVEHRATKKSTRQKDFAPPQRISANTAPDFSPPDIPAGLSCIGEMREGIFHYLTGPDHEEATALAWYGEWHHEQLALLASLVKLDQIVIELGSGIGVHSVALSRLIGAGGHILAFENDKRTRRILGENLRANKVRNATVMQNPYKTSRDATGNQRVETIDALELVTLDWIKVNDKRDAKIVLEGASETIWRARPRIFVNIDDNTEDVRSFLGNFGYTCWLHRSSVFRAGNLNRLTKAVVAHEPQLGILAIPEEVVVDVILQGCEAMSEAR